eukprot:803995_1
MGLIESCSNDKQDKLWQQKVMQEHKHQMTSLIKDKNINKQMQSIKEEHEQLTLMLNDLTQKLQQQISENQILRKELTQTQMNSDNYEEELCDETLKNININIQQPQEEINETSQAEIDTHYEELHAIHIDEKNISENRVRATLTEAQLLPDVKTFIWNKYKTTNVYDDADHTQDMYDDNISVCSESSLDSKDKMEIAFVKRKTMEKQEIMYMQNELNNMQQNNQFVMKERISILKNQNDKRESIIKSIGSTSRSSINHSDDELRIS